jgi:hypothetical protein
MTRALLSDGTAAAAGGLIAHSGDFTLDLKLHQSELVAGTASEGGLAWVHTGGTGHLDWADATLKRGSADAGAAFYLTGESTGFDGAISRTAIRDSWGGPAIQVDPDMVFGESCWLDLDGGSMLRNRAGGVSVPAGFDVTTTNTDLGADADDNGDFDIRTGDARYSFEGSTSVACDDGVCEARE